MKLTYSGDVKWAFISCIQYNIKWALSWTLVYTLKWREIVRVFWCPSLLGRCLFFLFWHKSGSALLWWSRLQQILQGQLELCVVAMVALVAGHCNDKQICMSELRVFYCSFYTFMICRCYWMWIISLNQGQRCTVCPRRSPHFYPGSQAKLFMFCPGYSPSLLLGVTSRTHVFNVSIPLTNHRRVMWSPILNPF